MISLGVGWLFIRIFDMKLVIFYVEWLSFLRIKIEIGIEMLVFLIIVGLNYIKKIMIILMLV